MGTFASRGLSSQDDSQVQSDTYESRRTIRSYEDSDASSLTNSKDLQSRARGPEFDLASSESSGEQLETTSEAKSSSELDVMNYRTPGGRYYMTDRKGYNKSNVDDLLEKVKQIKIKCGLPVTEPEVTPTSQLADASTRKVAPEAVELTSKADERAERKRNDADLSTFSGIEAEGGQDRKAEKEEAKRKPGQDGPMTSAVDKVEEQLDQSVTSKKDQEMKDKTVGELPEEEGKNMKKKDDQFQEQVKKAKEDRKSKEEEEKQRKAEEEIQCKAEEDQEQKEEEKKRQEEERKKLKEEDKKRKELEEKKRKEEENKLKEEEKKRKELEEKKLKEEKEKKAKEEEKEKKTKEEEKEKKLTRRE